MDYHHSDYVDIAFGNAQLEESLNWNDILSEELLIKLRQFCSAHNTQIEYILAPYFAMSAALTGKHTKIESGLAQKGRTNLFLLMAGSPGSGKSCGFDLVVNDTKLGINNEIGTSLVTNDLSRAALLTQLLKQTEEDLPFLILATDEMGLFLNSESKNPKEWELKRIIYNCSFSGTDISSERMKSSTKINKICIKDPHLSIIGMTQPKPLFDWIKNIASNEDGLLDRYLVWVVKDQTKTETIPECDVQLPLKWPSECLLMVMKYHIENKGKQYYIPMEMHKKIHDIEKRNSKLYAAQWEHFLQLLREGKEEEAVGSRRQEKKARIARLSELVIRFSVGLHVGLSAMRAKFNDENILFDVPTLMTTETVCFAITVVEQCIRQTFQFQDNALRFSLKQTGTAKRYALRKRKSTSVDLHQEEIPIKIPSSDEISTASDCSFDENLLKKFVTFPAPFIPAKAIYYYTKGVNVAGVCKLFEHASKTPNGNGYLGESVRMSLYGEKKRPHLVFFRAPYEYVDKTLLRKHGIDDKGYERLFGYDIGGEQCLLRKVVEKTNQKWDVFEKACRTKFSELF